MISTHPSTRHCAGQVEASIGWDSREAIPLRSFNSNAVCTGNLLDSMNWGCMLLILVDYRNTAIF